MPERILIVDDEDGILDLLAMRLEEGSERATAGDGAEAWEMIRRAPPDVVLLDIMMPGLSGREVAERMRGEAATASVPIIFITAVDAPADEIRGLRAGAVEFLVKPFDVRRPLAAVRAGATGRAAMTPGQRERRIDELRRLEAAR